LFLLVLRLSFANYIKRAFSPYKLAVSTNLFY
jgi:hypothetical protein